ncbi:YcnI family copper-binding membrane protein [Rothia uropygialis]|uniref:YcnI family copper-binding membrane protein n=1 Tax=Kocuria sp. 36 TaxID=1415402 RepID=UPI00101BE357|nr:YcnI family protein [Kocuria sp. 36]
MTANNKKKLMRSRGKRPLVMMSAAATGALALTFGGASAANAHVTVTPDTTEAGAYSVLTFSVPHGCDGAATNKVAIQMPQGIDAVTPTRNPFYSVEVKNEKLDTPINDSDGNEVTERASEVVYKANTPLPDGQRDTFELSAKLPDNAAGKTLNFPTVQTCENGESAWVQIPAKGQDADELELPSPQIKVTATGADDPAGEADSPTDDSDAQNPLAITSLVIGSLGLVVAIFAVARRRKKA